MNETQLPTDRPDPTGSNVPSGDDRPTSRLDHVLDTVQTVLTALILAFIFRAFLVEQFIIPTGSMAHALLGAHATRTCPACGWEFDFAPYRTARPTTPGFVRPPEIICPNCQLHLIPTAEDTIPKSGDRILVNKWPYALGALLPPHRWDIIVFRDPNNAEQHLIKRVIGLPNETVEIVAGNVFINGQVARKPPYVQRGLWFIVYDQGHLPNAAGPSGKALRWRPRDPPTADAAGWSGLDTRIVRYDGLDDTPRAIAFNPDAGREYLLDFYAYDCRSSNAPVGDVRIVAEVTLRAGDGWCRWEIERDRYRYSARLERNGRVTLHMQSVHNDSTNTIIGTCDLAAVSDGHPMAVEFAHVDQRVYLKIDGRELLASDDNQCIPSLDELRQDPPRRLVSLSVAAAGLRLELRKLRIDRDVYYTRSRHTRRAYAQHPFTLGSEEYFVLGDNSPDSHDAREWSRVGRHVPPGTRPGTVRADQIVGQAAFVYLPGLMPGDGGGRWFVPDLGRVRFVR